MAFGIGTPLATCLLGAALIVVARWSWRQQRALALPVGTVSLVEVVGAFLLGYAIGELISPEAGPRGGRSVVFGRFGPAGTNQLPLMVGLGAGALAIIVRLDLASFLTRDVSQAERTSRYVGELARVVTAIPAGGFGDVVLTDLNGRLMTVAATADSDIAEGTHVQIIGTRKLNLLVAPLEEAEDVAPGAVAHRG